MKNLINYILNQDSIVISTVENDESWTTNLFYWYEKDRIYFISGITEKHSQHILINPNISFANSWYNKNDFSDRKWIQWTWKCYLAEKSEDIKKWVELHNKSFPQFKERITLEYILDENNPARVWYIDIDYVKYWDDKLYWNCGTKDFYFNKKED